MQMQQPQPRPKLEQGEAINLLKYLFIKQALENTAYPQIAYQALRQQQLIPEPLTPYFNQYEISPQGGFNRGLYDFVNYLSRIAPLKPVNYDNSGGG